MMIAVQNQTRLIRHRLRGTPQFSRCVLPSFGNSGYEIVVSEKAQPQKRQPNKKARPSESRPQKASPRKAAHRKNPANKKATPSGHRERLIVQRGTKLCGSFFRCCRFLCRYNLDNFSFFESQQIGLYVSHLGKLARIKMGVVFGHSHRAVSGNLLYLAVRNIRHSQQSVEEVPPRMNR